MKTKNLISTLSLMFVTIAFTCNNVYANLNSNTFFSKTIKESVLQNQSLHENKKHATPISTTKKINLDKDNKKAYLGAMRIIKNEINPRIHFTSCASVSSKAIKPVDRSVPFNRLNIICLGRFIIPAANVLLFLF